MTTKRALLVGIDVYPDPQNNLNSCVADTQRFRGLLQGTYGFDPQNITMLHNSDATLANVRGELGRLFAGVSAGDEIVFFESSHGYRYVKGTTYTEVLCLYDAFLEDTELVDLSQQVPPGTLTCVLDVCHTGGLEKLFFAPGGLQAARAKVWQPTPERAAADMGQLAQATSYKAFAHTPTSDTGTVAKLFSPAAFGTDAAPAARSIEGGSELNGVLFTACLADQTAAAGSPPTDGLSAFTWAFGREIDAGGAALPASAFCAGVDQRLLALNMRQTPIVEAPIAHTRWLAQTLVDYRTVAEPKPTPEEPAGDELFDSFLQGLGLEG